MSIIVPNAYALALSAAGNADLPILGWNNLVTVDTLTADQEDAEFPATNLANPATNLIWKSGSTSDQYLKVLFGEELEVDYIAVARHNFGTGQVQITVQGLPFGGDHTDDGDWEELVAAALLANDSPALWRWEPESLIGVRLKLEPGSVEPQATVLYCGALLVFERGLQAGHTPINYGRQRTRIAPRSEAGELLGAVISGGKLTSSVSIKTLTAAWYRSTLDPFFDVAAERPVFWAWSPGSYPAEIGYVQVSNDPQPVFDLPGQLVDIQLQWEGLIL